LDLFRHQRRFVDFYVEKLGFLGIPGHAVTIDCPADAEPATEKKVMSDPRAPRPRSLVLHAGCRAETLPNPKPTVFPIREAAA